MKPPKPGRPATRAPGATYRLQFNQQFTFTQALEIVDYLHQLGVTDAYASPLFKAGPESTHGYDVCAFDQLSPALGRPADFDRLASRLRELGMGLLLDMVPNHMGNDLSNAWWLDVLEHGPKSRFGRFFDINWQSSRPHTRGRILLPILDDEYAKVLESGKLQFVFEDGAFWVRYHDRRFPLALRSYSSLLGQILSGMPAPTAEDHAQTGALAKRAEALDAAADLSAAAVDLKAALQKLHERSESFRHGVLVLTQRLNGVKGKPASFDELNALLDEQFYRLAFWKVGPEEINYRRFFDVTTLASVRMEDPAVFKATHELVFTLLRKGQITGLRIDHPDGLWDPGEYFRRLQTAAMEELPQRDGDAPGKESAAIWVANEVDRLEQSLRHSPVAGQQSQKLIAPRNDPQASKPVRPDWPLYVVVEKILSHGERLRWDWAVAGTTGYEFLNEVNGIFVNSTNADVFDGIYRQFSGNSRSFAEEVYDGKRCILEQSLVSEWVALTDALKEVADATRYGRDFTWRQFHEALREVIASFPVYRTYATARSDQLIPVERAYVEQAVAGAHARASHLGRAVFDFVQDLLLLRTPRDMADVSRARVFVMRFQQLTGPVTAKGLEDTAFYRYNRLISLNEVGGDPGTFGISIEQFHEANLARAEFWPHTLLATSTHDTKRGEDARARLNVLSEMPVAWEAALQRWGRLNADKLASVHGQPAPSPNAEYLLYQTLLGAWPFASAGVDSSKASRSVPDHSAAAALPKQDLEAFRERISAYMTKALREAKDETSWTEPNSAYEEAVHGFIQRILDPALSGSFLEDFQEFQAKIAHFGKLNSLAQLLVKLTAPGVPDFYQGAELWDFSLVDPDNRRTVDFARRKRLLSEIAKTAESTAPASLLNAGDDGEIKLWVTCRGLQFRAQNAALFATGAYLPLTPTGPMREHVCAFARVAGDQAAVTVVPRLVVGLMRGNVGNPVGDAVWHDTAIELQLPQPGGPLLNVFTGEKVGSASEGGKLRLRLADVLATFPVALLSTRAPES